MPSHFAQLALLSLVSSALAAPFRPTGYSTGNGAPHHHGNSTGHHHHHHHHNGTAHGHNHTRLTTTLSSTSTVTVVETLYETVVPTPVASVAVQDLAQASAPAGACKAQRTTTIITSMVTVTVQAQAAVSSTYSNMTMSHTEETKPTSAAVTSYPVESSSMVYPSFVLVSSVEAAAANVVATSKTHHHKSSSTSSLAVYSSPSPVHSSAPAHSSAPVSSSGTGKRGLPYNDASLTECFVGNSKVTWAYNWGQTTSGLPSAFEYVPMIWGLSSDFTSNWFSNANKAIASGSNHLLCFNEPDLNTQANLSPAAAAKGYLTYMQPFKASHPGVQLGGPAVTNGGTGMGLDWLSSFISDCAECDVDFYPLHWYDSASNAAYFKSHVQQAHQLTGKPIWVTEIGATGSDAEISAFLEDIMAWMDSQDYVQRYAYFMVSNGLLISGNSLSEYGKTYATA